MYSPSDATDMRQSSFRYLGLFDLLIVAAFTAFFGVEAFTRLLAIPAMTLAGVSALLAGTVSRITLGPVTVTWRYLAALTYALFAVILPSSFAPSVLTGTAARLDWFMLVVGLVGSLCMLYFAAAIVRDGDGFVVEEDVETVVGW